MITHKQIYDFLVKDGQIKPVQQVTASQAINRYKQINMIYGEAYNLYSWTAEMNEFEWDKKAQLKRTIDTIYHIVERALIEADLQVLSKGVIRQIGFYTNDELMKATWLMHVTQVINDVSIEEINNIVTKAIKENIDSFRTSIAQVNAKREDPARWTDEYFMRTFKYNIMHIDKGYAHFREYMN